MLTHYGFFCIYMQNSLTLQRVFNSIRFKVNKDWGLAKPLFYLIVKNWLFKSRSNYKFSDVCCHHVIAIVGRNRERCMGW